jgi:hypothetical protein
MRIKRGFVKFAALSLTAGAVAVGGLGFVGMASADGGPQGSGNQPGPTGARAGFMPQRSAGVTATAPVVEQPAGFRADLLAAAAQRLGITRAALQQELQGQSLSQVSHAVPVADLKTTLVDAENAALQKATAAGTVNQDQANQQVSNIPNMVQRFLDRGASANRAAATSALAGSPAQQGATGAPRAGRAAGGPQGGPRPSSGR